MTPLSKWMLSPLLCLLAVSPSQAAGPYDDLLKWIPEQANTLLLIDVYELHKSPLGKQENWAKTHKRTSLGSLSSMSPSITKVVMAAQINPKESTAGARRGSPRWRGEAHRRGAAGNERRPHRRRRLEPLAFRLDRPPGRRRARAAPPRAAGVVPPGAWPHGWRRSSRSLPTSDHGSAPT